MRRKKMDGKASRSYFTNTANAPHPKNIQGNSPRGGYRL